MFYAILLNPEIDNSKFDPYRAKYDPLWPWIKPHVTLVYPFDYAGNVEELEEHIKRVVSDKPSFNIGLEGIEKAWDNFIMLKVTEGRDQVIDLHQQLYTGILSEFLSQEYTYNPHLTIGFGTPENADQLFKEAEALDLSYTTKIASVALSAIDLEKKQITYNKSFNLKV